MQSRLLLFEHAWAYSGSLKAVRYVNFFWTLAERRHKHWAVSYGRTSFNLWTGWCSQHTLCQGYRKCLAVNFRLPVWPVFDHFTVIYVTTIERYDNTNHCEILNHGLFYYFYTRLQSEGCRLYSKPSSANKCPWWNFCPRDISLQSLCASCWLACTQYYNSRWNVAWIYYS